MRKFLTTSLFLILAGGGSACSNSGNSGNSGNNASPSLVNRVISAFVPGAAQPAATRQANISSPLNGTQRSPIFSEVGATYGR